MINFILTRTLYGALVVLLVTVIISTIIYASPVDPARLTFGQRLDESALARKKIELGLDKPLSQQVLCYVIDVCPIYIGPDEGWRSEYEGWVASILGGKIGLKYPYMRESYQSGRSVTEIIASSFPHTLILTLAAMTIAIFLGLILGVTAAMTAGSITDRLIVGLSTIGYSVPSYVSAIALGVLFGYYFRSWSGLNMQGSLWEFNDLGEEVFVLSNLFLPAIALGIRPVAIITQLMRSAMLEAAQQKYVTVARAKGLSNLSVVKNHIVRNALNPVVTSLSGWFASLLAGAFFVEFIFNFKGMGFVTVNALLNYDIPVILGALLFTCVLFVVINIAVDLLYRMLDPRIAIEA